MRMLSRDEIDSLREDAVRTSAKMKTRVRRDADAVLEMWADDVPSGIIAARTGMTPEYVRIIVQRARAVGDMRAQPRPRGGLNRYAISSEALANLDAEASRRNLTPLDLVSRLLETIGREKMFNAILDD